jgi:putative acetyltransferase
MDTASTAFVISQVYTAQDIDAARAILREYAVTLGVDLCFQTFENELASLPGDYAVPTGSMLLARNGDAVVGCCALRPLQHQDHLNACEMKRLYVRPGYRSLGLGRQLILAVLHAARVAGYRCMLLDSLDSMHIARTLYAEMGFVEIAPYYQNPIEGLHYLKIKLH